MDGQLYSLSTDFRKLAIRRRGWEEAKLVHLETVEISPQRFCFEWEDGEFQEGENLHVNLHLPNASLDMAATILSVQESGLVEGGYDLQRHFTCCAEFRGEIEGETFKRIKGTPRRCETLLAP
jgi:hypothetical protein